MELETTTVVDLVQARARGLELVHVMLTPAQYAARRGVTPRTLANERARGEGIPYVKHAQRVMYRLSDVLEAEDAAYVVPKMAA